MNIIHHIVLTAHTASYRGCAIYKELLKKRNLIEKRNNNYYTNNQDADFDVNAHNFPNFIGNNVINNNQSSSNKVSYYQVVRDNNYQNEKFIKFIPKIEALMAKQIETTPTLLNMMSALLKKLCKLNCKALQCQRPS